jgi:hypothetical protein
VAEALSPPYLAIATIVIRTRPDKIDKFLYVSNYFSAARRADERI